MTSSDVDANEAATGDSHVTVAEGGRRRIADEGNPGDIIGQRYELLDEIGRGAFGQVFRARDRVTESVIALKLFSKRQSADAVKRLKREVQLAHRVTHPGVVRTYDLVEAEERLCVSMEYVDGMTLSARLLQTPPLTTTEVVQLATDLARALAAAHRAGVIHRDLKPANILLRKSTGRAVIVDFGISRHHEDSVEDAITREGQAIGTPRYMPPEQLLAREIGPTADLYAWALVIYEAAAGRSPHEGKTATQLAVERSEREPPDVSLLRPDLPPALSRAIRRCLEADPAKRLADGQALKAALAPDQTTGDQTAPVPRSPRLRAIAVSSLVVLLLAAGATGIWWWRAGIVPRSDRRIAFHAVNGGGADDAWIGMSLTRMAARRLRAREPHVRIVDDVARANIGIELTYRRAGDGLTVEARGGPMYGRLSPLATITSPSLAAAADQLVEEVTTRYAADQPLIEPDESELTAMERLGTHSFPAYWRYRAALEEDFSAVLIDAEASDRAGQRIVDLDPQWAHAWICLIDGRGLASARGQQTLAEAKKALAHSDQDRIGKLMLQALESATAGRLAEASALLDPEFRSHPDDMYLGWILARRVFHAAGRTQDALAVFQKLFEQHPDLQFGANLIDELRRAGRGTELKQMVTDWLRRTPESEDARAAMVVVDLESKDLKAAVKHARDQVFVHGDAPHRLATLADVLIAAGDYAEASRLAESMLRGSGSIRSRGWVRLGIIATLEGRFGSALDAYESAIVEGKAFPWQSGLRVAYESVRWLAAMMGRTDEADRYDAELIDFYRRSGMAWQAATVDYDRQLLHTKKGSCPDRAATLATLPDGLGRKQASVEMLRSGSANGCATCADVLREGLLPDEWKQQSLYRFGMCAASENALALARDAFNRVRTLRHTSIDAGTASAEVFAVLARYQLGRVLERMGDRNGARAAFEDFLGRWGHADRRLGEVEDAQRAIARLR
ncbi:MAG: Fis family transcriptional regulator [Myxococcales bacterium]|nr:Fis family transcriptional regulator [Myxococcales bacterium]